MTLVDNMNRSYILLLIFFILSGCDFITETGNENTGMSKFRFMGSAQGTYYVVTYYSEEDKNLQPEVDSILNAFDLSVSMWVPGSIISRINSNDTAVIPDAWFTDLFKLSKIISDDTDGAFDMTVGPLVNAWGFGFQDRMELDEQKVDSLLSFIGYKNVELVDGNIVKENPGIRFDFNAIAQGYSVDVLARFLESKGIADYLVDIGGEIYGRGSKPGGEYWKVAIEKPAEEADDARSFQAYVNLSGKALATSGSYRKYYEKNGVRYSHTIDPVTGYPVTHNLLSVSVLAETCALADGYATAFMVMGLEKARDFLKDREDMEAYFIISGESEDYETYYTKGFEEWLSVDQP